MTAHNQHRPRIRASAVAAALASVALTAQANLPLLSGFTAAGNAAGVQTYNVNMDGAPGEITFGDATASTTLSFFPMTRVEARADAVAPPFVYPGGTATPNFTSASGQLNYSFDVYGAANTSVRLNFDGSYGLTAAKPVDGINWVVGPYGGNEAGNDASVQVDVATNTGVTSIATGMVHLVDYYRGDYTTLSKVENPLLITGNAGISFSSSIPFSDYTYDYRPEVHGDFSGYIVMTLDGTGYGHGSIGLFASASTRASAFIDPYLSIDPAYLAAHPEATLNFAPDVGNAAPVPEPSTHLLLAGGLLVIGAARMRRAHRG